MSTWGGSTVLQHDPDAVWDFLTSATNDVNWRKPWVVSVRQLTPGPLAIGTRYDAAPARTARSSSRGPRIEAAGHLSDRSSSLPIR